jgi:hypothetical protein
LGDQIEKNEMSGAYRMYGGEERVMQGFGGEIWGKRPLGRPWWRWEEVEWGHGLDLSGLG